MRKGSENHNWFSLSIPEYIEECSKAINKFEQTKGSVISQAKNLQKKVVKIEQSILIRPLDQKQQAMSLQEFSDFFDQYRVKKIAELVRDYQEIGNVYLKTIEQVAFQEATMCNRDMKKYYQYWERKIFNAIISMTIRALATNKAIWQHRDQPLINQTCTYNSPEMTCNPSPEDMQTQLKKFTTNILDASKNFGRWYDGHCIIYPESQDTDTSEKSIRYTFYDDVIQNPVLSTMTTEITTMTHEIERKRQMHEDKYLGKEERKMNDKNNYQKLIKQIERNLTVQVIEPRIMVMKQTKKMIKKKQSKIRNSLIQVDYTQVKTSLRDTCMDFLKKLGEFLTNLAKTDLAKIKEIIREHNEQLSKDMQSIDEIKNLLESIAKIRNKSMDMELKIAEAQEQFRVLKMYKYPVDPQDQADVDGIAQEWADLIEKAERTDHKVNEIKGAYSELTKG